jgi:hypothetical protein
VKVGLNVFFAFCLMHFTLLVQLIKNTDDSLQVQAELLIKPIEYTEMYFSLFFFVHLDLTCCHAVCDVFRFAKLISRVSVTKCSCADLNIPVTCFDAQNGRNN